jgi:hypothetical protein
MQRVSVRSRNLASVGYEEKAKILEVEFKSGAIYQYFGVPEQVYRSLIAARSVGSYFERYVRHRYRYRRID